MIVRAFTPKEKAGSLVNENREWPTPTLTRPLAQELEVGRPARNLAVHLKEAQNKCDLSRARQTGRPSREEQRLTCTCQTVVRSS